MLDRHLLRKQPNVLVNLSLTLAVLLMLNGMLNGLILRSEAAELQDIRQRGYLVVGVKDNWRPLGFRGQDGELQGLEIDLARWLADRLLGNANAVALQPLTNQERLSALLNDEVDVVIAAMALTASRSRLVDFSTPYYFDGTTLITRHVALRSLTDLRQQPIAVLTGSSAIAVVRSYLPSARLVGVASYEQAKEMLDTHQVAAFAGDASVLAGWAQEYPDYYLLPQMLSTEALAVAMPRGRQYTDLRQQVNQAIQQWQLSGTLEQQILNWGLPEAGVPRVNLQTIPAPSEP
ncbi:transporter substrate-binding domain-containing protein [Thermocoleostomius sinensis]|uniref:Transporter substrate-binding domain-containing protein n=1 Tax=Thermocoleostomius sinensis A174 TaxID=2016057 RepID=A0A9E8Z9B2_9CYAN|nr:transporter substrate-binding domain-containing protein [Thermocoleostomius sinensis]WAL58657.1 transporter substrate-binding domain-containing protein [Thermocoleostomius sinensis A174]